MIRAPRPVPRPGVVARHLARTAGPAGGDPPGRAEPSHGARLETDAHEGRPLPDAVDAPAQPFDVELVEVTRRFGEVTAVDDLTLRVATGSFYSLLGPSGCGKTTTLRLVAGFEQPDAGAVRVGGRDVTAQPAHRRNVNTVFQHYALFPHLSVADNVGYGLKQRRVPGPERARRVDEALELVRLPGYGGRRTWQLSGGQQQRVALARALVNRPTVLLLDEPLGALDLKLRREMQHELKSLQATTGITFVYVTHDQEEALTMSDRLAVMRAGRVVQEGSPEELYESPVDRYVAGFIGLSNFFAGRVVGGSEPDGEARSVIVEVASGRRLRARLPRSSSRAFDAGSQVTVAVRPERVSLGPETDAGIVGRLTEATYLGGVTEFRVQTEALGPVVVRRQNGEPGGARYVAGQSVTVTWGDAAALALAD